ncbi:TetR/AcrR family transcriptional regulator [Dactylosporangium cerinum]
MTFSRYGFRKTSMDAVAREADISRPGLYFLFTDKAALFRETMRQALDDALAEVTEILARADTTPRDRLAAAMDAWLGRHVGTGIAAGAGELLENSAAQLGTMYAEYRAAFLDKLADAVVEAWDESAVPHPGIPPRAAAEVLHAAATGWKYQLDSRAEFVAKTALTVNLMFP